jgi:spermidine/putrescine transport system permease protein
MKPGLSRINVTALVLGLAFLYLPILLLVIYSFNASRLVTVWGGFSTQWYGVALSNAPLMDSAWLSLRLAVLAAAVATLAGTALALALTRLGRFRGQRVLAFLGFAPLVIPEIVTGLSLLLLFIAIGMDRGFWTVALAHATFTTCFAAVVVQSRLVGFDRSLEEAAMDLGASPLRTFLHVTLPTIAPGVLAAALLVFALSIDDYVITSFVAGVGSTTLPIQIYSMVKSGVSPAINAISTLLLLATSLLLLAAFWLESGKGPRRAALPGALGLLILGFPFLAGGGAPAERTLNLYIWSGYIAPETLRSFEARHKVRVNLDLYDTNEALLAKLLADNVAYDVICPSNYIIEVLSRQGRLRPLDHSALPHLGNLDPRFLDRPHDPGNRVSVPYFWGSAGIAWNRRKVGEVDSWAALWDERYAGRILMLDDARETLGAALRLMGRSLNATDPALLAQARDLLVRQKPLVKTYNSSNYEEVLLSGDVWLAQGWNGQFAKAMDEDPDIAYVIPKEGGSTYIDALAIPAGAPHPELAHAFIDFTLEAEVAAEICRTMRYSTPNRAALPLLPGAIRRNPAIFPPDDVLERLELIRDMGDATLLYDRSWTEVKAAR